MVLFKKAEGLVPDLVEDVVVEYHLKQNRVVKWLQAIVFDIQMVEYLSD